MKLHSLGYLETCISNCTSILCDLLIFILKKGTIEAIKMGTSLGNSLRYFSTFTCQLYL